MLPYRRGREGEKGTNLGSILPCRASDKGKASKRDDGVDEGFPGAQGIVEELAHWQGEVQAPRKHGDDLRTWHTLRLRQCSAPNAQISHKLEKVGASHILFVFVKFLKNCGTHQWRIRYAPPSDHPHKSPIQLGVDELSLPVDR